MTPSNANTSGLEVAWARLSKTFSDRFYEGYEPEIEAMSAAVVTAASAQARIDAAEARADRLADIVKLLDECIWFNPDTQNFEVNHDGSVEKARAALQQETQP